MNRWRIGVAIGLVLGAARVYAQATAEEIGSLRNARVAYSMPAGAEKPRLVFLAGRLTDEQQQELRKIAPNVDVMTGLTRESALEHAAKAHAIDARLLTPAFLERAPNLVWVSIPSAGVDRFMSMKPLVENGKIVLTNSRAVHGPAIADHAFGMLLELSRNLRSFDAAQKKHEWLNDTPAGAPSFALQGKTMLVVGIGGIGTEIAQRAHGFGMKVIATRRTDTPAPAYVERVGKPQDLLKMLPEADVVAVCVPLTPETDKLINKEAFAAMKQGAFLINIARGRIVDSAAMLEALKSGRLGGACLDVTDPEPLNKESPLWDMPNVVITPHVAADAELTSERGWVLLRENIRRFGVGEPLLNVVDVKAGY